MSEARPTKFIIVGGGLGGALLGAYLGRAGHQVDVYEMRDDPRTTGIAGGRSINLALSYRGLCALEPVGLAGEVLGMAVPMRGRMIHSPSGNTTFQPYGVDDSQAINSVSRGGLNVVLLNTAAKYPGVRLFFNAKCTDVSLDQGAVELVDTKSGKCFSASADVVLSVDGAFSAVRRVMQRHDRFNYSQEYLDHGYKELTIPGGAGGAFQLEKNALHIWPRRSFMMIALPNSDGSFTCTLFWPFEGPHSFASISNEADLRRFFERQFPDALPLMPNLAEDYFGHPTGSMVTVRCSPWHVANRVALLGDAAHAVVPFYGQGMNAAFEDVLVLDQCIRQWAPDWGRIFTTFETSRRPNTDALADLAIHNFVEMRDHTGSKRFRLKKKAEKALARLLPGLFVPLYTLVTFTRTPYVEAVRRAKLQVRAVALAIASLMLLALAIILGLARR
jgi:kynurenine 3-monooxygenase